MTTIVSLWGNFANGDDYPDEILFETENTLVIKYCGQNEGGSDKYVGVGNYFFSINRNRNQKYTYIGRVIKSTMLGKELQYKKNYRNEYKHYNVQTFELVISKEPKRSFCLKSEACDNLGLTGGNLQSGIINHMS